VCTMQHAGKIFRRVKDRRASATLEDNAKGDGSDKPPATVLSVVKARASIWNLPNFMEASESSLPGADSVNDKTTVVWDESVTTDDALGRVATAVQVAEMAVKMDSAGDLSMASRMYKRAIVTVVLTIEFLAGRGYNDLAMYDSLHMIADGYQGRVNVLERRVSKQQELRHNRQSRVPFVPKDPGTDASVKQFEEAPEEDASARRPFWQLRLVHRSILFGGFVSPTIYVPRDVWRQHNAKFNALSIKIGVFENLLIHLQRHVVPVFDPERPSLDGNAGAEDLVHGAADAVIAALERTVDHLKAAQTEIARSFSFVQTPSSSRPLTPSTSTDVNRDAASASMDGSAGGNLATRESPPPAPDAATKGARTFASTFSRVVDTALTTYKRAEAAVPGRVSTEILAHYAELVSEVCEKSQRFDQWLQAFPPREEEEQGSSTVTPQKDATTWQVASQKERVDAANREKIRGLLTVVSALYRDVVCEVVLRDLQNLVERYIKKMRKSFARMYWDEDAEED
jgi:hypothetical protein